MPPGVLRPHLAAALRRWPWRSCGPSATPRPRPTPATSAATARTRRTPATPSSTVTPGPTTDHAPRGDGRDLRPHPPRSPRGRQRGADAVRPRRGRLRPDRGSRGRRTTATVIAGRAPLPHDRHRDRLQPALHRQPRRHRPGRADLHDRHPARPAARSARTPSCSSSPAPTRWPRSCRGRTSTSCWTSPTSSASPGPGTSCPTAACPRTGSRCRRCPPWRSAPPTAATRVEAGRAGLVPRARRRRPVHHQVPPVPAPAPPRAAAAAHCSTTTRRMRARHPTSLDLAKAAAAAAEDKLATKMVAIDVSEQLALTDIFVIVSAPNDRQVGAIVDEVEDRLRELGRQADPPRGRAGRPLGAPRLRRHRRPRPARGGARVLRARAALEGLPGDRPERLTWQRSPGRPGGPARLAAAGHAARRRLLIWRHGQTDDNASGVWQGQLDTRPVRRAAANRRRRRRRRSRHTQPSLVVTSDLQRAAETARRWPRGLRPAGALDARLREIHVGQWQGMTAGEVARAVPRGAGGPGRGEDLPAGGRRGDPVRGGRAGPGGRATTCWPARRRARPRWSRPTACPAARSSPSWSGSSQHDGLDGLGGLRQLPLGRAREDDRGWRIAPGTLGSLDVAAPDLVIHGGRGLKCRPVPQRGHTPRGDSRAGLWRSW